MAAFIRNTTDMAGKEIPMEEISTIGSFSLSLFLGLAMMGLKLWELADLAIPMVVMLVAQTVLMMVYAYFVVFNLLGKNYDAAVMTSGFCGFGMGATPNAMANMQAITQKYGPAPTAYFVVPLVGSLFIDFMNTIIITSFLNLLCSHPRAPSQSYSGTFLKRPRTDLLYPAGAWRGPFCLSVLSPCSSSVRISIRQMPGASCPLRADRKQHGWTVPFSYGFSVFSPCISSMTML